MTWINQHLACTGKKKTGEKGSKSLSRLDGGVAETDSWQGWSIENVVIEEIVPFIGEKMKLLGCWATIGHGVDAKAAGIHDGEDCWSGDEEEERCWKC